MLRGGHEAITQDAHVRENENEKRNDHHAGEDVLGDYSALSANRIFFDKIYSHCGQRAADKNQNITIQFYLTKLITKVSKSSFPCAIHKNVKVDIRDKIKVQDEVSFVFAIIVVLNKRYTIYNIYMRT